MHALQWSCVLPKVRLHAVQGAEGCSHPSTSCSGALRSPSASSCLWVPSPQSTMCMEFGRRTSVHDTLRSTVGLPLLVPSHVSARPGEGGGGGGGGGGEHGGGTLGSASGGWAASAGARACHYGCPGLQASGML